MVYLVLFIVYRPSIKPSNPEMPDFFLLHFPVRELFAKEIIHFTKNGLCEYVDACFC